MPKSTDVSIGFVVTGDATGGVRAIKLTDAELKKLNNTQKQGVATSKNYTAATRNIVGSLGKYAVVAGGVALAATAAMVGTQRQLIDNLAKTSDRLNIQTEDLQGLRHITELSGESTETLDKSLEKMVRTLGEAQIKSSAGGDAIEALGLNLDDIAKMSADEQFIKIGGAISQVNDRTIQASLSADIFGRNGIKLLNVFDQGEDAMRAASEEIAAFGGAITRIDAAKVEIANDQLQRTGIVTGQLAQQVTVQLAPIISGVANEFLNVARESGGMAEMVGKAIDFSARVVGVFADGVHALNILWQVGKVAVLGWAKFVVTAMKPAAEAVNWLSNKVAEFLGESTVPFTESALGVLSEGIDKEFNRSVQDMHDLLAEPLPSDEIEQWVETVESKAQEAAEIVAEKATDMSVGFAAGVEEGTLQVEEKFKTMNTNIIDDFSDLGAALKREATNFLTTIATQFVQQKFNLNFSATGSASAGTAAGTGAGLGGIPGTESILAFAANALGVSLAGGVGAAVGQMGGEALLKAAGFTVDEGLLTGTSGYLLSAAAGVAGGYVGSGIGGLLTDKQANSDIGQQLGGGIGAAFGGPVGAFIGSTIGSFVDTIFGSKVKDPRFTLGPTNEADRQDFAREDLVSVTSSPFGSIKFQSDKDLFAGASEQDAQQMFDFFDSVSALEGRLAGVLDGDQVAEVSAALAQQEELFKKKSMGFQEFFVERFGLIFDTIGGDVDKAFDNLTKNLNSEDFVGSFEKMAGAALALVEVQTRLDVDLITDMVSALEDQDTITSSVVKNYKAATEQLMEVSSAFDFTAIGVDNLTRSLTVQQAAAAELVLAYSVVGNTVEGLFTSTIDQISRDILSDEDLYGLRRGQISDLNTQLGQTTDPGQIQSIVQQLTSITSSAFGQLDEGQKKAQAGEFTAFLQQAQVTADAQIARGIAELTAQQALAQQAVEKDLAAAETIDEAAENFISYVDQFGNTVTVDLGLLGDSVGEFGVGVGTLGASIGNEFLPAVTAFNSGVVNMDASLVANTNNQAIQFGNFNGSVNLFTQSAAQMNQAAQTMTQAANTISQAETTVNVTTPPGQLAPWVQEWIVDNNIDLSTVGF